VPSGWPAWAKWLVPWVKEPGTTIVVSIPKRPASVRREITLAAGRLLLADGMAGSTIERWPRWRGEHDDTGDMRTDLGTQLHGAPGCAGSPDWT
jgi:hypothetical protein